MITFSTSCFQICEASVSNTPLSLGNVDGPYALKIEVLLLKTIGNSIKGKA
jgi:hypothetical protein